jgi:pre-mRNA-splicing factor CWC26
MSTVPQTLGLFLSEIPIYQGPQPAPNRFKILPGYRWDGVDRSNGFEKRCFEKMSQRKALETSAYQWSTEEM